MKRILRIGLTGGIGSGKSTVAQCFMELGVPVIDADQVTRELCQPGQPALAKIVAVFGQEVLDADGQLNRTSLRERIFTDAQARRTLEDILHPGVRQEMVRWSLTRTEDYAILVIPLLYEHRPFIEIVDRVIVVDCPDELRIQRVMARDHVSRAWVEAVMAVQVPQHERLEEADNVLINDSDLDTLKQRIAKLRLSGMDWMRMIDG